MTTKIKNILLVDDDSITNFINRKILERSKAFKEITIVNNGRQALDQIKENILNNRPQPDITLLDINMPIMGECAFLKAYRDFAPKNNLEIEIVILSSSENASDIAKAKTLGIKRYLTKPIAEKDLSIFLHS